MEAGLSGTSSMTLNVSGRILATSGLGPRIATAATQFLCLAESLAHPRMHPMRIAKKYAYQVINSLTCFRATHPPGKLNWHF